MLFGFLYSPAYPLGTRLGITLYWSAASIQTVFSTALFRQYLTITQWLLLWFYAQRIYFVSFDVVDISKTRFFLALSYISIIRAHWRRRRRFKRKKKRVRVYTFRRLGSVPMVDTGVVRLRPRLGSGFGKRFLHRTSGVFRAFRLPTSLSRWGLRGAMHAWLAFLEKHFWRSRTFHSRFLRRFVQGMYNMLRLKRVTKYSGPTGRLKRLRYASFRFLDHSDSGRVLSQLRSFTKAYRFFWFRRFISQRREYFRRALYVRYRRLGLAFRTTVGTLRFFWYLKLCFERYFFRHVWLWGVNLYTSYFQPHTISRLALKERNSLFRYVSSVRSRRHAAVTLLRRLADDIAFRPPLPVTKNKYTYAQVVLFLSLAPLWRKLVNTYSLCYLVIVSALLKKIQPLSQWLYNLVSLGTTRRFRMLRMRFFSLMAKVLRDYAVFGHYIRGFRIEVYGKTGRSQKTRTRFFGDSTGLKYYNLGFRMQYQAFDIPTFAGILGIRFWLF